MILIIEWLYWFFCKTLLVLRAFSCRSGSGNLGL